GGCETATPGYSKNNPYGLRGRFITNIKFKARLHTSDFVMDLGHIATAMLPLPVGCKKISLSREGTETFLSKLILF
ncbi:MAG: hypothetical protein K2M02_01920, partial [Duncaniella sp.]|nr:hypothetical protein [Duncaniella sp.]